uniref:Secreted protein n=1 Tax=Heterorhabditis bacteriophora TaxID=37862 RepID=A0A1I7W750_HETBA
MSLNLLVSSASKALRKPLTMSGWTRPELPSGKGSFLCIFIYFFWQEEGERNGVRITIESSLSALMCPRRNLLLVILSAIVCLLLDDFTLLYFRVCIAKLTMLINQSQKVAKVNTYCVGLVLLNRNTK